MSYEPTEWVKGTKITATKLNNIEQGVQSVNSEYTPTTWAEGDIVTATKLNNIEQGIANAGGGSGDFSTAQVTIVSNSAWNGSIYGAWMTDDTTIPQIQAESYGTVTGTLILKDGYADLWTMGDVDPVSVSENAEMMEYGWIQVTGDCTITYN